MKHTLMMRLEGPMQSWGSQSRFTFRDSGLEPTKSGVIGLVCAALGRDRSEDISDLAALRMGVRVLREGQMRYDFHTAGRDGYMRASGKVETSDMIVSKRYYLADASFLVGLESSDRDMLGRIAEALCNPVWPIFLGRKSFVPSLPVYLDNGLVDGELLKALRTFHISETVHSKKQTRRRPAQSMERYVIEPNGDPELEVGVRRLAGSDQPLSFQPRRFALREVVVLHYPLPTQEKSNVPEQASA